MSLSEYNYTSRIMGCDFDITYVATDESVAHSLYTDAFSIAQHYEKTFSRFDPVSELSILNLSREIVPSELFFRVMQCAQDLYKQTRHNFNPLVQITCHGYTASFEHITETHQKDLSPPNCDFDTVVIQERSVRLRKNQRVDVAGFLKGYVAHIIADATYANPDVTGVIINIGGDIATRGKEERRKPFVFGVYNPITQTDIIIPLTNTSLSTSGTYKRSWKNNARDVHHILSPHTHKNPKTSLVSATVITPHGAQSDAYATTAIILGAHDAQRFLTQKKCTFILITDDGAVIQNMR